MEIVKGLVTNYVDAMSGENDTTVNICVSSVSDYHLVELFV